MAIIGTEQEDPNNPNGQGTTGQPASQTGGTGGNVTGGASGYVGGGTGQGATTSVHAASAPTSSGNYSNLTSYLEANQGSGATTGQAAENVVQQSADAASAAQNQFSTDAGAEISNGAKNTGVNKDTLSAINASGQQVNQGTLNAINAGGIGSTGDWAKNGGIAAPTVNWAAPTFSQAAYTGPNDTNSFGSAAGTDQKAALAANGVVAGNAANANGGQAGVSALLRGAYQQPSYTAGENSLDAFLAGGTAGGQAALGKASGVAKGVNDSYAGINSALSGQIGSAKSQADATNTAYSTAMQKAKNTTDATAKTYNDAFGAAQAAAKAHYVAPVVAPPAAAPGPSSSSGQPTIGQDVPGLGKTIIGGQTPGQVGAAGAPIQGPPGSTPQSNFQGVYDTISKADSAAAQNVGNFVTGKKKLF